MALPPEPGGVSASSAGMLGADLGAITEAWSRRGRRADSQLFSAVPGKGFRVGRHGVFLIFSF